MGVAERAADIAADFSFSDADFHMIADFAKRSFGLDLQMSKKPLVYSRISKRLKALGLQEFSAYCDHLGNPSGAPEIRHLLTALTTNVTHFFREMHHFEYLAKTLVPVLRKRALAGESIRLWSSACSAGQEAYCMAAVLLREAPEMRDLDVRILATDIDPDMIALAKAGRYPADQLTAIPSPYRDIMLSGQSGHDQIIIAEPVRQLVYFSELNLIADWPIRRQYDVIFCRNVAIYFDKTTQADLWARFARVLAPQGHLMIGHSERVNGPATQLLTSVGITTYTKNPMQSSAVTDARKVD